MIERIFRRLPLSAISPEGYLLRQLEIQARGLTGNIRFIWEDLSDNSAWLGGTGEAWERGPYYLDGLIPLGFLLGSEDLKNEISKWVESILSSQTDTGFFGPAWNKDWWPRAVVLKGLVTFHSATGDARIIPFIDRYLEYQYKNIDSRPPVFWASARALESAEAIELVYRATGKEYLPQLADKLKGYMYDWFGYFSEMPYPEPATSYMNRTIFNFLKCIAEPIDARAKRSCKIRPAKKPEQVKRFNNSKWVKTITMTHGVNIAMAVKYPAVYGMLAGDTGLYPLSIGGYLRVMEHHGTANGLWTSDEHLSGPDPSKGTELCTVAEMMYSLEEMLSITGDPACADALELIAYNTLPATFTPDMCCHQYVQQANQISADKKRRLFFDADSEANTFGLEPNYGCCAANMHQGFPKFAANACYMSETGPAFMIYAPCLIRISSGPGMGLVIRETTDYPFSNIIRFDVLEGDAVDCTVSFRIPALTSGGIFFNGSSAGVFNPGIVPLKRTFNRGDTVEIILDAPVTAADNPDGSLSLRRGSILLALRIEEKYIPLRGKEPFNYRQFVPVSDWNLAPVLYGNSVSVVETIQRDIPAMPFDTKNPPIEIRVKGVKVKNWRVSRNSAGPIPARPEISDEQVISMVPYGCTNIRVSQFPGIKK